MRNELGSRTGAVAVLIAAAAVAQADPIALFHTGTDASGRVLPPGTPDPHYTLVAVPPGSGVSVPSAAMAAYAHPAYVPGDPVGAVPGASWIALGATTDAFYAPGDYVFRTTFDLTGLDPATAHIDGYYAADDGFADVLINGASTGIYGGVFNALIGVYHIDSGFRDGVNTLDFVVRNAGGAASPSGMRMFILGTASPKAAASDHVPPAISGPTASQPTLEWHGSAVSLTAALLGLSATDDVDGAVAVVVTPSSVGLGDTVVTARAVDAAGNAATMSFKVRVQDTVAPTFVSLSATPDALDERNHKMINVTVRAVVADAGDSAPSVKIVSVSSNDGGARCGPSRSSDDWKITGPLTAQLRAERSGRGDGRVYVITVQATDASGNVSTATVKVVVGHDSGHGDDCGRGGDERRDHDDRDDRDGRDGSGRRDR